MKYEKLESGYYYHIYNQGNNRENIFFKEKNYDYFLHLFKKYIVPITETYAYCLLPNHFHFLLRIKIENEDYLKRLVLYIHTNAQHHGIIDNFENYPHSSFHAYIAETETAISKSYILKLFEDIENFMAAHKIKSDYLNTKFEDYLL
jgi:putative transposase